MEVREREMGRTWTPEEDKVLIDYIRVNGEGKWSRIPKKAGLKRCGKSCRFRWMNYLRPDIKRGNISWDEEELIIRLHNLLGNRWSLIAGRLPGRTDNEIKNYWNSTLLKKLNNGRITNQQKNSSCLHHSTSSSELDSNSGLPSTSGVEASNGGSYEFLQSGFEEDDPRWNFARGFVSDDFCLSDLPNADYFSETFDLGDGGFSSQPSSDKVMKGMNSSLLPPQPGRKLS